MGHEVYCLMCLGTGIKMDQMNSAMITKYNELMLRRYKITLNHMYACYECAYLLNKYSEFQEKCCKAFKILGNVSHGSFEVTKENLKQIDRKQNKLESLLSISVIETIQYQPKENCPDPQIVHKKIKRESSVDSTKKQCNENVIEEHEELKLPIIIITSMCNNDRSENSEIYKKIKSNMKNEIEEDNNNQCIDVANAESFGYTSNEESALVGIPDAENLGMCEKKADEIYPIELDIESLESNCESVSFEHPEIVITSSSDGNKMGTRKRKCVMQGDNKIHSNKSIKKTNKNNELGLSVECVSNKDVKAVNKDVKASMKKKTERRRNLKVPAKKKKESFNNFFKDHMTIIQLSPEDARCELLLRQESRNYKMTSHKCDLCYRGFITEATYQAHMKKHSLEYGNMKCDICLFSFSDKASLSKHWTMSHSWKFTCKTCSYICFNGNQAKTHIESHNGKKYICKDCGESFRFPNTLSTHIRKRHNMELACEFCGSMFASAAGIKIHKILCHKKEKNEHLGPQCDECDVHFASERAWKRHRVLCSRHEVHNGCGVCGETFSTKQELKSHSKEHGQRKTTLDSQARHVMDFNPIPCTLCNKEVPSRNAYVKHMNTEHPETNKELTSTCVCEVCGKAFKHLSCLISHQRKHTDEKPFSCLHCSKKFKNEYTLKVHLPVHTNEYSFKCHLCEKAFSDRGRLNAHVKRHLGVRPYKCSYCEKSFAFQCEERIHTKYVHYKEPYPKRERRKRSVKKKNMNE